MKFIFLLILIGATSRSFAEDGLNPAGQGSLTDNRAAALALINDLLKEPTPEKGKQKPPPPPIIPPSASDSQR